LVVEVLHAAHRLVPTELRVDLQDVPFPKADRGPMPVVQRVAVGDDRIEAVVAAEPLEDDQDPAGGALGGAAGALSQRRRHRAEAAEQAETESAGAEPQELAAGNAGLGE